MFNATMMKEFNALANSYGIALAMSMLIGVAIFGLYLYERKKRAFSEEGRLQDLKQNEERMIGLTENYNKVLLGVTLALEAFKNADKR